jgi:TRAP-type C4-dicarboxylate transport system substrate-binding protein
MRLPWDVYTCYLKGLKIRGTVRIADTIKALGGTPVSVEMVDACDGLQRGVINGILDAMEAWRTKDTRGAIWKAV